MMINQTTKRQKKVKYKILLQKLKNVIFQCNKNDEPVPINPTSPVQQAPTTKRPVSSFLYLLKIIPKNSKNQKQRI